MSRPIILLSNDDGIHAKGIQALRDVFREFADLWVVAPDRERSAVSQAISLHTPLRIKQVAEQEFSVDGTPCDSVYVALNHLMPTKPDLVISGINHGPNLGNDVLYSGTVGAAMEGALCGLPAISMSLCLPENDSELNKAPLRFGDAAAFAETLAKSVLENPLSPGVLLNVNVPNRGEAPKGVKVCRLGYTDWAHSVHEKEDPRGKPYFWIGGERRGADSIPDSDNNAICDGWISVTPIHYDLSDHRSFEHLRNLELGAYERVGDNLGDGVLPYPTHPKFAKSE